MLEDKANGPVTRRHAAAALVHELAAPTLASVADDADDSLSVRRAAVRTLGKLAASSRPAVRALGLALTAEARSLRWIAVLSLRDVGPSAKEAEPQLRRAIGDRNRYIREMAATALRNIDDRTP